MKILFVSAEVAPFAKVGGLADVAGSLPKALARLGHEVRVVMPLYRMIETDPRWDLECTLEDLPVRMNPRWEKQAQYATLRRDGVDFTFIGTDEWFTESKDSESVYQPGGDMHLFFATAILRVCEETGWIPDVVNANDWHTGFLPVLMRAKGGPAWDSVATVFTIHNLAYQGEFGPDVLDKLDLPRSLYHPEHVEAWGRVNFLKAGCTASDLVNTVSPNYAREIQTPAFGCALDGLMRHLAETGKLYGILNGIDTDTFNPATDRDLPHSFAADSLAGKAKNKAALLAELGLPLLENAPLFGVVSRLSSQKGLDLIAQAGDALFELPVQLIIQGLGDPSLSESLRQLERRYPNHFRFVERFDAPLAQRVYAGCDGFLMPSAFEPCGLGQLIAMRYGTVPVVRSTGGLADTVFEGSNGFTFERPDALALVAAVARAVNAFRDADRWKRIQHDGMTGNFGWEKSARAYVDLYETAMRMRSPRLTPRERPDPRQVATMA